MVGGKFFPRVILVYFWFAFAQDWASIVGWVHPPYSMGERVLDKILATSCFTGAVCLPDWPSQAWYTQFHNICTTFRTFDSRDGMFLLHGKTPMSRPNWNVTVFYFVDFVPTDIELIPGYKADPTHINALMCTDDETITASHYLDQFPLNKIFVRSIECRAVDTTQMRTIRALYDDGAERDRRIESAVCPWGLSRDA